MEFDNPDIKRAYDFIQYTNRNLFLTGKAGTGKTTFLHRIKKEALKRMVVVAPTGVAAINAGGVTIHSFFQLPFGPIIPSQTLDSVLHSQTYPSSGKSAADTSGKVFSHKMNKSKIDIIRSLELLVIDEISMVRADLLDGIDEVLRLYRKDDRPFGGVQLLMIGDLQQLAPVVKDDERQILESYYKSLYFFGSRALQKAGALTIELQHVYRQNDEAFIHILNEVRENKLSAASEQELNKRYRPNSNTADYDGYITLTTHNYLAREINEQQLNRLKGKPHSFTAEIDRQFPEYSYPTDLILSLKTGAQVMFVKNDSAPAKRYYNGKIGTIESFEDDQIFVRCEGDQEPIVVEKELWDNVSYTLNKETKEIEENVAGTFTQYPLRLAWAITIHKSQGLTFEKAIIDASSAFAHGQTYVALSRCKSLEGLVLSSPISSRSIICDNRISEFTHNVEQKQPDEMVLEQSKQEYQLTLLSELFNYAPVLSLLYRCRKILSDNASSVQGNLLQVMKDLITEHLLLLNKVSATFIRQIKSCLNSDNQIETNLPLQERIKKACLYFYQENEQQILTPLANSTFVTDNQGVQKQVDALLLETDHTILIMQDCLKACQSGFVIREYLQARAKALLQKRPNKKKALASKDFEVAHPDLLSRLMQWRKKRAEEDNNNRPIYFIASQKLLIEIANYLPCTEKQMKAIKGMGPAKMEKYGRDLLTLVAEYCDQKGFTLLKES